MRVGLGDILSRQFEEELQRANRLAAEHTDASRELASSRDFAHALQTRLTTAEHELANKTSKYSEQEIQLSQVRRELMDCRRQVSILLFYLLSVWTFTALSSLFLSINVFNCIYFKYRCLEHIFIGFAYTCSNVSTIGNAHLF
ncbi:unnamed protein product [Protopolystoma xenopodis]|uniref:Uncharacterized protein n=1 Tax=Protopolystoma xenopodis TaxID=117903 RepID=A0A3S5CVC2_9PLAT|nr:unnamed protein product [Protopolystoma xenopodis]